MPFTAALALSNADLECTVYRIVGAAHIQEAWTKENEEHVEELVKLRGGMQFNACAFVMKVDMSNPLL